MAKNGTIKENDIVATLSFGENYSTFKLVLAGFALQFVLLVLSP